MRVVLGGILPVFLGLAGLTAVAEVLPSRMLTPQEATVWRGVGPVNIAGEWACTGVLISDHEVLTAAHCLYHRVTLRLVDPKEIKVVLGQDRTEYAALAKVRAIAVLPGFVPLQGLYLDETQLGADIALLELAEPVPPEAATPLPVAAWQGGGEVDVLGYGRDRPFKPMLREGCPVATDEVMGTFILNCAVQPAPAGFAVTVAGPQGPVLAALVVAQIVERGQNERQSSRAVVIPVGRLLDRLRAHVAP